ncbi:MAG: superoxide dismutase [Ni] [Planctomycetota bacterium]
MKTIPVFTALTLSVLTVAGSVLFTAPRAEAHCQVPCGIFGDELKFAELSQHIDTMEKAMVQIVGLADSDDPDNQQKLIRWVVTKEDHAQKIMDEAQQYFLAQRVKLPKDESEHDAYLAKLVSLHEIIVYAMKCKQTTDTAAIAPLRESLETFRKQYFGEADHTHTHSHDGEEHAHAHDHGDGEHSHDHSA